MNPFSFEVLFNVSLFLLFRGYTFGITARFLLDFKECVDVIGEELVGSFRKMPYFVQFQDLVTFLQCFLQFYAAPRPLHGSFAVGVGAGGLVTRIGTGLAKGKDQFTLGTVG